MADSAIVDRLLPGDHVCWPFDGDGGHVEAVAKCVHSGLNSGHRIVVLVHSLLPAAMRAGLEANGVPVGPAEESGQLRIASASGLYLPNGVFEPNAILRVLATAVDEAREQGWAGLRLVGDMAWALPSVPGIHRLVWFEAQVNRLYTDGYALGLCLYDRKIFNFSELAKVSAAHPGTAEAGEDPWVPLLRMLRTRNPAGLRLSGEADVSSRHALSAVINGLFEDLGETRDLVTLDVSDLEFADAATAHLLMRAVQAAPYGMRLVGCRPQLSFLMELVAENVQH